MATILKFPIRRQVRGKRQAYMLAFRALLCECICEDCTLYRQLLETDPQAAEDFLFYEE